MKVVTLTALMLFSLSTIIFSQSIKLSDIELDSVKTLIGYTYSFPVNYTFNGEKILRNGVIESVIVKYEDKGYFDDMDAHYEVLHEYNAKFHSDGSLSSLDSKYYYDDGIDIFVNYHFLFKSDSNSVNCWFKGNYGHIMPLTELEFEIEPFNFEEAFDKVVSWWHEEFDNNRSKYIQN